MIRVTFWPGVEVVCELDDPSGVWRARGVHPSPAPEDFEIIEAAPSWTTVGAIENLAVFVPLAIEVRRAHLHLHA